MNSIIKPVYEGRWTDAENLDAVVFLDVDGVLIPGMFSGSGVRRQFDIFCVIQMNRIVQMTGAKICLSSTWRLFEHAEEIMIERGVMAEFVGRTPYLGEHRGADIQRWLDGIANPPKRFVIVDDDSDMDHLSGYLVKTDSRLGLSKKQADQAILQLQTFAARRLPGRQPLR